MSCEQKCECIPQQIVKSFNKKKTIPELDLSGCNVEHIHNLKQIKIPIHSILLAGNRISNLAGIPFMIIQIDISNNQIKDITQLQNATNLKILRCANNLIEKFEFSLPQLELLDASYNKLTSFPTPSNLMSLNLFGNQLKNYQEQAVAYYRNLIILDGFLVKESKDSEYIVAIQEQQLAQKFHINIDYLNRWRQEVFKQLIRIKALKIQTTDYLRQVSSVLLQLISKTKWNGLLEIQQKRINSIQKQMQSCLLKMRKQKQTHSYERKMIICSLKNLLEEDVDETKIDQLIKQVSQMVQGIKLQNQQLKFEKEVMIQEKDLLKAQVDHFQQMYNQIKTLKNDDNYQDKNKGLQQLYQQIRSLEEEKIKLSIELNNQKELKSLEILQNKAQLEQQVALLQQELEYTKQKLNVQQEETRLRIEQFTQQYEKRIQMQEKDNLQNIDKVRQDYQAIIQAQSQKEYEFDCHHQIMNQTIKVIQENVNGIITLLQPYKHQKAAKIVSIQLQDFIQLFSRLQFISTKIGSLQKSYEQLQLQGTQVVKLQRNILKEKNEVMKEYQQFERMLNLPKLSQQSIILQESSNQDISQLCREAYKNLLDNQSFDFSKLSANQQQQGFIGGEWDSKLESDCDKTGDQSNIKKAFQILDKAHMFEPENLQMLMKCSENTDKQIYLDFFLQIMNLQQRKMKQSKSPELREQVLQIPACQEFSFESPLPSLREQVDQQPKFKHVNLEDLLQIQDRLITEEQSPNKNFVKKQQKEGSFYSQEHIKQIIGKDGLNNILKRERTPSEHIPRSSSSPSVENQVQSTRQPFNRKISQPQCSVTDRS